MSTIEPIEFHLGRLLVVSLREPTCLFDKEWVNLLNTPVEDITSLIKTFYQIAGTIDKGDVHTIQFYQTLQKQRIHENRGFRSQFATIVQPKRVHHKIESFLDRVLSTFLEMYETQ
eukprot:45973_1